MYHSQHEIEKYLQRFFDKPGFFLEIGCWDGELISQTAWLERERNWIGLCVDPFARGFEGRSCRVCRKAVVSPSPSPSDIPLPQGERVGAREFVKVSVDRRNGGDVSYFSGFKDALGVHWDLIREHCDYEIVEVETITLEELWRDYELPVRVDFLSVDVEGAELEIFESIDFDRWSFGLIAFEHNLDEAAREAIGEILRRHDYCLHASLLLDDVYVNRKLLEQREYKAWLDNEYRKWIEALQSSTVHNFKENPMVKRMLGHIDEKLFSELVSVSPIMYTIDKIGSVSEQRDGSISGVCLRMIYYANKVLQQNPKAIVEIGGGVGQFYAVLRAIGYEGSYMILDLPEVQDFQIDYLAEVAKQTGLDLMFTPADEYDFCVSFYALGEFDDDLKERYIEDVVKKCRHGFIVWNPHSNASSGIPFDCTVTDEYPLTYPGNKQLVW